jgi:hypothetical protein
VELAQAQTRRLPGGSKNHAQPRLQKALLSLFQVEIISKS